MPSRPPTLAQLRGLAISRTLFAPTTLPQAIGRMGFVQMDPIRAPARAQDLTLRHRVRGYRAGELEARYPRLALEEDFFINYGVLPRAVQRLMHPRRELHTHWPANRWKQAQAVLDFVKARGSAHPDEVDAEFGHGRTKNWFGGNSRASTQLLDGMHYRGLVRTARRDSGVRVCAPISAKTKALSRIPRPVDRTAGGKTIDTGNDFDIDWDERFEWIAPGFEEACWLQISDKSQQAHSVSHLGTRMDAPIPEVLHADEPSPIPTRPFDA